MARFMENLNHSVNKDQANRIALIKHMLKTAFDAQREQLSEREFHIHRVEHDSIADLSKWAGIELKEPSDEERCSHGEYPIKLAYKNRDDEELERLSESSGLWTWFKTEMSPEIEEFYTGLGYDFWWNTNG
jgi:hypothetical protein